MIFAVSQMLAFIELHAVTPCHCAGFYRYRFNLSFVQVSPNLCSVFCECK